MSDFKEIEILFHSNFSFDTLKDKLKELKTQFTEEDILSYFLTKNKDDKKIEHQYLLPIFLLSPYCLEKNAIQISEEIPLNHINWVIQEFGSSIPKELIKYFFIKQLSNYKNMRIGDNTWDEDAFFTYTSEVEKIFKLYSKHLPFIATDDNVQKLFSDVFEYLFNEDEFSSNIFTIDFLLLNISEHYTKPFWTKCLSSLITNYKSKNTIHSTSFSLKKLLKYDHNIFSIGSLKKIANYFNSLTKFEIYHFDCMQSLNKKMFPISEDIHLNLDHLNELVKSIHEKNCIDIFKWLSFIELLKDNNKDTKKYMEQFCLYYWSKISNKEKLYLSESMKLDYLDIKFHEYVMTIDNQILKQDIYNIVLSYMDVLMSEGNDEIYKKVKELNNFSYVTISEILSKFVDIMSITEDEKYNLLRNIILTSKNEYVVVALSANVSYLTNGEDIAASVIQQSINTSSYHDWKIIRAYLPLISTNKYSDLIILLTQHSDNEIKNISNEKIMISFKSLLK